MKRFKREVVIKWLGRVIYNYYKDGLLDDDEIERMLDEVLLAYYDTHIQDTYLY